jgi:HK97 family phage portal protein
VTTLQTADGRLLRAQRPPTSGYAGQGMFGPFRPMWSDGTSDNDIADTYLKSYEAIYRSQPVLAGVVDKLARRLATLPLIAYEKKGDSREVLEGDSLDTLLRTPMPRRSTVHLLTHIFQSLLIHGNGIVAKFRGPDPEAPPVMLWPLDWAQLSAYGPIGGTVEWWSTTQFEGQERFIRVEDTIHYAWPAPSGSEIGVSPLEKLGVTIRLEDAIQRDQTSKFKNGVRPSAAVSIDDPNPTDKKLERASAIVKAGHGGMDKSGSWVFMGANARITPLSFNAVEVELIQQRKLDREEIGIVYDMGGPLMNDFEHATFTNVTEMLRSLYRDVAPPWTELFVQTTQVQLLNTEPAWLNRLVRFSFDDKLKGDPSEQSAVDKSDVESGIRTRDEARESRGLEPMGEAANELTVNANNQALLNSLDDPPLPPPPIVDPNSPPPGVIGRQGAT